MMSHQRLQWSAMLVAAGIVVGCGGGSGDDDTAPSTVAGGANAPLTGIISPDIRMEVGGGAKQPVPAEEFNNRVMESFIAPGYEYANASLKLLISAIGPKPLLDHLEQFKKSAANPGESAAAARFIELIHKAFDGSPVVYTEAFFTDLQELAPFNQRNAAGALDFTLRQDPMAESPQLRKFLLLVSQLFRLDTLPGWSFDIDETLVYQGEERAHKSARNASPMFQPVDLARVTPADQVNFSLQKIVDLLHADQEVQVQWRETDPGPTVVKVRRQVSIADVPNFKRLTISLEGSTSQNNKYSLNDPVTLAAIDRQTQQKILLTLAARQAILWDGALHAVSIRQKDDRWATHHDHSGFSRDKSNVQLINFEVTSIAPAP